MKYILFLTYKSWNLENFVFIRETNCTKMKQTFILMKFTVKYLGKYIIYIILSFGFCVHCFTTVYVKINEILKT